VRLPDAGVVAARAELAAMRAEPKRQGSLPQASRPLTMDQEIYRELIEMRLAGSGQRREADVQPGRPVRWGAKQKREAAAFERARARVLRKRGVVPVEGAR
jgi:hypothetical protein